MNTAVHSVPTFNVAASPSGSALLHISGALVLVLLVILAVAWLARRAGLAPQRVKGSKLLTVVGGHSIGQRERLVVVEMAGKHLLLGVTATSITCLAMFDKSDDEAPSAQDSHFQSLLLSGLKKQRPESE